MLIWLVRHTTLLDYNNSSQVLNRLSIHAKLFYVNAKNLTNRSVTSGFFDYECGQQSEKTYFYQNSIQVVDKKIIIVKLIRLF
jgi:hypothetical protein